MEPHIPRSKLAAAKTETFAPGDATSPCVFLAVWQGDRYVIKDFSCCALLFRRTVAPFLVRREFKALQRAAGLAGAPRIPFLVDRLALGYSYLPGRKLSGRPTASVSHDFFAALERLVAELHARNLAHLDLRRASNIIVMEDGRPGIVDFQASMLLDKLPRRIRRILREIDMSGVYKNWARYSDVPPDALRMGRLAAVSARRRLWPFS